MRLDQLAGYATLLYGDRWQTQIAALLGLNERTVRIWVGRGAMPDRYVANLHSALIERMHKINDALDDMEANFPVVKT